MNIERILNNYYNIGGYNNPSRIGYMMKMIRELHPLTEEEWKIWYLENVHNEEYINELSNEMFQAIPYQYDISLDDCKNYIYDVMFRRTFLGYNKENLALKYLQEIVSPNVKESPAIWDTEYFIDFYIEKDSGEIIGIQLKPDTFYLGDYHYVVDIKGKMDTFCKKYNAQAYILEYKTSLSDSNVIEFVNPNIINEIKSQI